MFFSIFGLYTVPDSSPYTFFPLYILPPIRSSPYTFFPLYKKAIFPYLLIPQKNTMPLFLKAWIPKENPFKTHGGLLPHKAYKYVFYIFWLYTVPDSSPYTFFPLYILPPIRSSPYTFFPLSKKAICSISLIPQKNTMPLFLKAWIPKENPFKTLGGLLPTRHISMFSIVFGYILFLILPPIHSSPYTFFPLAKRRFFPYF